MGSGKNKRIKRIPLIPELRKVLDDDCGLQKHWGKDEYAITPELSRKNVKNIITKGFTHFKRVAGIDEKKCFKDLKKTYISRHRAKYGDMTLTTTISDHSNKSVVDKYYIGQIEAVKKSSNFCVFPESEDIDA